MKLLVRNLARTTTEAELRALFEAYGPVQYCTLITDEKTGKSKGFGFIEMPKPGDAKAATRNLDGKEVAGNKIRVKKAQAKQDTVGAPDRVVKSTTQDPLHGVTLKMVVTRLVELEAGCDARVAGEAFDIDAAAQFFPAQIRFFLEYFCHCIGENRFIGQNIRHRKFVSLLRD